MARVTWHEICIGLACTGIALVPWAFESRPNAYAIVAGCFLAGVLLGFRAIGLVIIVCFAVAAVTLILIQLDPHPASEGEDGRGLFVYLCATVFPAVLSGFAGAGALARWLASRRLPDGRESAQ